MIAISRIILNNIPNIQASILTVGKKSDAFAPFRRQRPWFNYDRGECCERCRVVKPLQCQGDAGVIKEAGFVPGRRNQKYEFINPLTAEGRGENF